MGCGCNKKNTTNPVQDIGPVSTAIIQEQAATMSDFYQVVYNGPGYTHLIPSRTGVIGKLGMSNYGSGKKGTIIYAHIEDIEKYPEFYTRIYNAETEHPTQNSAGEENTTTILETETPTKSEVPEKENSFSEPDEEVSEEPVEEVSEEDEPDEEALETKSVLTPEKRVASPKKRKTRK